MKIKPYLTSDLKKLRRGPAITLPKDFGIIVAYTGINKNSKIIEIGTGSGFLTVQFSRIAKKIITYEKRKDFADLSKNNFQSLKLKNVKLLNVDAFEGIDEKDADLFMIDIHNAHEIVKIAFDSLKEGGYLAAHCLSVEQSKLLFLECKKIFKEVFMVETLVREYDVDELRTRPKHIGIIHTAYLLFARK
ncbi:MAG: rRNA adenine N-6-methyltransferase family protein [Candidatus ainarchaeum sp.]|nr:rRNA adenine N-6-methyltransferase family protein [Candidatus ainarchaeum sp.]